MKTWPGISFLQRCTLKLKRLFSKAVFEVLIFGGAYIRREICVSKSIGLACSWKEICVRTLKQVFTETRLEDVVLSKTQPCKYFLYMDR